MAEKFNPFDFPVCFTYPLRLVQPGAWVQHIPFAMYLVSVLRPQMIVELGTHTGNSYCSFCQAVKELHIESKCYAIDTWKGDPQAGYYGDEVFNELRDYHDPLYGHFSHLIRSTFDDAAAGFGDNSIDLLHIDGLHTYDAVKHDFETWLPKVKDGGIVLFHDTYERQADFGVWKLWQELQSKYNTFEFLHGHGLGVLSVGETYPSSLDAFFGQSVETTKLREYFFQLGLRLEREQTLDPQIAALTAQVNQLQDEVLSYRLSTSWKITAPVRFLSGMIKGK